MMNLTVIEGEASSALFSRAVQLVSVTMLFLLQLTSASAQVPRIGDVNPIAAHLGDTVTISGANFGATPADNVVYFGAVRATVKSASTASLTVLVPSGAIYAPVSVTVGGLTAYSRLSFVVKFDSIGKCPGCETFANPVDFPSDLGESAVVAIADIDGDGKPDLIVANRASQSISVFQNLCTTGSITAASFAPRVEFPAPGALDGPVTIAIADLDGDGKLDIIAAEPTGGTIFIFRNTTPLIPGAPITSGSLAPAVTLPGSGSNGSGGASLAVGDIDGDGRPDIIFTASDGLHILRNTSAMGALDSSSFAPAVFTIPGTGLSSVAVADIDGDGKADVVAADFIGDLYLLRNISTVGAVGFEAPFFSNLDFLGILGFFPVGVNIGDLNGDGKPDIALSGGYQSNWLIQNNAAIGPFTSGEFEIVYNQNPAPIYCTGALADFSGNGIPDIAGAGGLNDGDQVLNFLPNTTPPGGDLNFLLPNSPYSSYAHFQIIYAEGIALDAEGIALGDLDGDGKPDIVATYFHGGKVSIVRNTIAECTPPQLISLSTTDGQTILLGFDQAITADSAQNVANYTLNLPGITVTSATWTPGGVSLTTSGALGPPGAAFTVTASSILAANCNEPASFAGGGTLSSIVPSGNGGVQTLTVGANQSAWIVTPNISAPLNTAGQAAASATVNNASGSATLTATAATYAGNPTGANLIDVGGGYVDLQISGASASDSVVANFYYPSSITGTTESSLTLQYYNGSTWAPVLSSGGVAPLKNTTDNLDGTTSGGRFTVTFDSSSTPPITALGGTVFALAPLDTTPPVLGACPTGGPYLLNSGVQTTPPITATDNCALNLNLSTLTYAIDTGSVGTKPVTFKAVDTSGNTTVQNCSYQVIYQPAGVACQINGMQVSGHQILPPVNPSAPYSVFKQGSVVPLKFAVFDANCKSVGTPGVVTGMTLEAALNGTTSDVNETIVSATPDSAFRWDSANQQWVFNLSTKNLPKNATFYYTVTLNDGTTINFQFGLR